MILEYVADANVVMSILISGKPEYRSLLTAYRFSAPDFIFTELKKYEKTICEKARLKGEAFQHFTKHIFLNTTVLPSFFIDENAWHQNADG